MAISWPDWIYVVYNPNTGKLYFMKSIFKMNFDHEIFCSINTTDWEIY